MSSRSPSATHSSTTPTAPASRLVRALARRWPTILGVAFAAFNLATDDPNSITAVLLVLVLATTAYVVIAALVRPGWSWPVLGVLVAAVVTARLVSSGPVLELAAMTAVAVGAVAVGAARGAFSRPGPWRWQPFAAVGFMALGLGALWLAPEAGRVLIAAGLIGHGVWDVVHWRRHAVVSRSLAEWCAALDLALGVGMLVLALA
ncbi:hypothetical protein GMA12_09955 [Kocuria sediminis]|uniref:Uncharacterized protein n=1 Tax=Kocuria sediminis TaxID=1038857 RepID=A0A6N8GMG9_9MICC|nr:hypothetical protein [Kocuria sediminis]MUN63460.1 hypothetical protein [Kocuria sediminis]